MSLSPVDAVLFDFDGTLIQPSIDFARMHAAVLDVVAGYIPDVGRYPQRHTLELIAQVQHDLAPRGEEAVARFTEDAHRAILEVELEAAGRVLAYEGAPALLETLKSRGLGVGIVTRNSRDAVERVLARIPMRYDVLLTRDDVTAVKPDPAHLLAALEVLGVPGERSLMCGDHLMDIVVGRRIGAQTAGILKPGVEASYFAEVAPDVILSRVVDLLEHLPLDGADKA